MSVRNPVKLPIVLSSFLLIALCVQVDEVLAQDTGIARSDTVLVVLVDGTEITGVVQKSTEKEIVIRTFLNAVMTIPRDSIASIEALSGRKYLRRDPNVSRLLFAPTARALGNGKGYFADYYLFFPFVAVGVGSHVNLAGGVSLIPGADGQLVYLAPKVTFHEAETISVAGGIIFSKFLGDGADDIPSFGMAYGVTTLGSTETALTVGLGLGFVDGDFADSPALMIGGEIQMSGTTKLISENYFIFGRDNFQLLSGGIRFFGRKLAVDIAMITSPDFLEGDGFPFIPFVGFAYNFGK